MKNFTKIFYIFIAVMSFVWSGIFSMNMAFAQPSEILLDTNNPAFIEVTKDGKGA